MFDARDWQALLHNFIATRRVPAALTSVPSLVSAVLLMAITARIAIAVHTERTDPSLDRVTAARPQDPTPVRKVVDLDQVLRAHLFGIRSDASDDAPMSNSTLILTGVIALNVTDRGFGIIAVEGSPARLYSVGTLLPDGSRLYEVRRDRVILLRNGDFESVLLPRAPTSSGMRNAILAHSSSLESPTSNLMAQHADLAEMTEEVATPVTKNGLQLMASHPEIPE